MPHYFDADPEVPSRVRTVALRLPDLEVRLQTDSGVFAAERVDAGTLFLLRRAPAPPPAGEVLDLGCGYGPIAVTIARRTPRARVWAVDVNRRALDLTARNAAAAGASNVLVALPDEVPPDIRFDAIYANPPVRIGLAQLHPLLLRWLGRLSAEGSAYLVVHRHLGSDSLARWLEREGLPCRRLASHAGYRILQVRHRTAVGDDA